MRKTTTTRPTRIYSKVRDTEAHGFSQILSMLHGSPVSAKRCENRNKCLVNSGKLGIGLGYGKYISFLRLYGNSV